MRAALVTGARCAVAALVLVAGAGDAGPTGNPPGRSALYIEEPQFEDSGRIAFNEVSSRAAAMFPDLRLDWVFMTAPSDRPAAIAEAIERVKPAVVVFANDGFAENMGVLPRAPGYVIPSDFPADYLMNAFSAFRLSHKLAFVSWYANNNDKLIELALRACGRGGKRIAAFFNDAYVSAGVESDFLAAARRKGIDAAAFRYNGFHEFEVALAKVVRDVHPDALYVSISEEMFGNLERAADLVARTGLPAVYARRDQVKAGGLVSSDGPAYEAVDQMALYAGLIARGADASRLAPAHTTRYEVAVNLRAADRIACRVPYELLIEATEVFR